MRDFIGTVLILGGLGSGRISRVAVSASSRRGSNRVQTPYSGVEMSPSKGTLGMWCTIAAAPVAVLGAVAPTAHATPPRPAAPVTTAVATKTCSDWVELKWPNGT